MDSKYLLHCCLCFTIFKGELVFYSGHVPGDGITGSTLDRFHVLFLLWPLLVVEKLFLKMKVIMAAIKDLSL